MADRMARALITVGGIGTILAVLGVCLFLVWVVAPLFFPAGVDELSSFEAATGDDILHLGVDEYQVAAWVLRPEGVIDVYRLDTGEPLDRLQLVDGPRILDASFLIRGDLVALALDNGEVQLAKIGFSTSIADADEMPAELVETLGRAGPDEVATFENGLVQRTLAGQYRIQKLTAELAQSTRIAKGPVRRISHVQGPGGPLVLALAEDFGPGEPVDSDATDSAESVKNAEGTLRLVLIAGEEHSNFLTGQTTLEFAAPEELPWEPLAEGLPKYIKMAGSGDSIYVAWADGSILRLDRANPSEVFVAERGRLFEDGELTALSFVLGNNTLVWGDSEGGIHGGFPINTNLLEGEIADSASLFDGEHDERSRQILVRTKTLRDSGGGAKVTALGASARTRLVLAGYDDGHIELYNVTNATRLASVDLPSKEPVLEIRMSPKEDGLVVATPSGIVRADLDPRHPEASLAALFQSVWYEGYGSPQHTWQSSSGTDDFEVKLGLVPLVFGTLKATVYSMLFGVPLALLAALFTSEFLHPRTKAVIKPSIELMASLPSVVLGFLAALVFAPFVEKVVPATLASFFSLPLAFLIGAYLWQLLPVDVAIRYQPWRFGLMALMMPVGLLLAGLLGPGVETWLFASNLEQWLAWDPGSPDAELYASSVGGWMLIGLPLSLLIVVFALGRWVNPRLRVKGAAWDRRTFALVELAKFGLGLVAMIALAYLVSLGLDGLGLDPRGSYVDTYVQRNALIVGFVMGFAIIPIIYTISEDALSTIPEHLRSASLGAGATPWQTATRIVVPTAMSGLFSAMMVGLGRAVGETMIVLMAAGNTPVLEWNIFEGFRTLSANIAVELPEAVRNSTHYRTLFLAALVLFVLTFVVNTVAEVIRQRFRKRAYQL